MASSICRVFLLAVLTDWIIIAQGEEYVVHIYTANKLNAGTDAPVYVRFHGENGVLPKTEIDPPGDSFERNAHDIGKLHHSYLGEISKIEVKRGSSSIFPDWELDRIEIEDPRNHKIYKFDCDCDIDKENKWYTISVKKPYSCKTGYRLVDNKCKDIDECQRSGACSDHRALCTNTIGSFHCRSCKDGYTFKDGGCKDVNECFNGESKCKQKCTNTEGSYVCSCLEGHILTDKYFCTDIDECKLGSHNCRHPAKCVNDFGGYTCECPSGYERDPADKYSCRNKDECSRDPNACDYKTSVKCTDLSPGYRCECKPGFYNEKDNFCKDINECQGSHSCNRPHECVNLEGSYRCKCSPGYVSSGDGKSCVARKCGPVVIPNGAAVRESRCTQHNANDFMQRCSFYCLTGYTITDPVHTQLTCDLNGLWKGTPPTCKPVTCQPFRVPTNGRIRPVSCSSGATYNQTCTFICNDGYDIRGQKQIRCLADRTWSHSVPSCDKVVSDLWISCPASISVALKPGESSADVSSLWKSPQTSNGASLTSSHKKTDRFPAGTSFVTWSVSNDNVHFKACTVAVEVKDTELPVAVNCPKHDILITTKSDKEMVKLPNVQFTDNVAIKGVDYSVSNPVEIKTGFRKTIVVTARDDAGNMAYCRFDVRVDAPVCGIIDPPINGSRNCNKFGGVFCGIQCNGNKVLFNATGSYNSRLWTCENYEWRPSKTVPDCVDYVDSNGSPCPSGKVPITSTLPQNPGMPITVCGDCPTGTYYESKECKLCPAGTYQQITGKSGPASCIKCPKGTSSKVGSKGFSECKATCPPGYFSVDGFLPCELCKLGEYQSNSESLSCKRCPSDRGCTRYQGATSSQKCGPCPSITRIEPSGNVKRLRGSLLEVFCYVDQKTSGVYMMRWAFNLDSGQTLGSRVYQKKLRDSNGKQIGLKLSVRDLQASAGIECILENTFAVVKKAVHVTVIDSNGAAGSGGGILNDDGLYEKELFDI